MSVHVISNNWPDASTEGTNRIGNRWIAEWTGPRVSAKMQKVRLSRSSLLLGIVLGVAGSAMVERALPEAAAGKGKSGVLERKDFHDTLDVVLDRYVETLDAPEVMARGLKHMVAGLDPHSHYLTAAERAKAHKLQHQGAEAGLVTALHPADEHHGAELEIVAVHPGSPAEALGLSAGDRILEIRGQACERLLSNVEAQLLLGGGPGERIDLVLDRGAGPESVKLVLAKPDVDALVSAELVERSGHAIGTIEIRSFRPGTGERVKQALAELRRSAGARGLAGVILDVRGNPGGEVDEALIVADLFVDQGVLTRTRGRGGVILREEHATAAGTDRVTPLVVLQDRRSASAAELLAVALRDHGRARVVGERSFGKGTVQEVIGIADGSLLTLTVARYFSPNDRSIDGRGVEPDVAVERLVGAAGVDAAGRELVQSLARR
jgi:carboxyl-terminal processing protease